MHREDVIASLRATDRKVLAVIERVAGNGSVAKITNLAFLYDYGCGAKSLRAALGHLQQAGLIDVEPGTGKGRGNIYKLSRRWAAISPASADQI